MKEPGGEWKAVTPEAVCFLTCLLLEGRVCNRRSPLQINSSRWGILPLAAWPPFVIFVKSRVEIYSPGNSSPSAGFSLVHTEALKLQPTFLTAVMQKFKSLSFPSRVPPCPRGSANLISRSKADKLMGRTLSLIMQGRQSRKICCVCEVHLKSAQEGLLSQ